MDNTLFGAIVPFYGGENRETKVLSQFFRCTFHEEGIMYTSAEQYMMAHKALEFGSKSMYEKILAEGNPAKCKALGRKVSNFDDEVWANVAPGVVYRGNLLKFSQNRVLRDVLWATGDALLVEASPTDLRWGCGLGMYHKDLEKPTKWRGSNWLGLVLMAVRDTLQHWENSPVFE